MAVNRAEIVDRNFTEGVASLVARPRRDDLDSPVRTTSRLSARRAIEIFESMVSSRHLDLVARELQRRGASFYTIGSSGHETNAAVAAALRPTDPAFLHYRSGGFYIERARQVPGSTPLMDVLLGVTASKDDPISGGRHKVFGSKRLWIPPQTSTIASHLPKAMGTAFAIARARRLGRPLPIPDDSIVFCSFGDASANHSTACGAFNAAVLADYEHLPCPVLFCCEDNGMGISVRTPEGWITRRFMGNPGIRYFGADGLDLSVAYDTAVEAVEFVRRTRRPALLHLRVVRLLGHAGSDVEQLYRSQVEIEAAEARDPVLAAARLLVEEGWLSPEEALDIYEEIRDRVRALGDEAARRPRLGSVGEVVAPLAPLHPDAIAAEAARPPEPGARLRFWRGRLPEDDRPRHMAMQINRALGDLLVKYPDMLVFGEDVARKGGVYHVTADLSDRAGVGRVFNTPLDETSILGLAIGAGHLGMLPVPEIQYLAYLHNAIDQLRGEAASLQFFSNGQFRNPMVVRIASLAYQKGFGGHFHNDNAVGSLREIPGLVIACPSNGTDAVGMLRTCLAAARLDGAVCAFLEPIALYMTKDLIEEGDGEWCTPYPDLDHHVPIGRARIWDRYAGENGPDLTIASYANGLWMSLRAAARLADEGIRCRVVDLRWLQPLPIDDLLSAVADTKRLLIVDECRRSGGIADTVAAEVLDRHPELCVRRLHSADTFVPLGDAANLVLVQEEEIVQAARELAMHEAAAR